MNRRNTPAVVRHFGVVVTLTELSARSGISYQVLYSRWKYGDRDDLLVRPVKYRRSSAPVPKPLHESGDGV